MTVQYYESEMNEIEQIQSPKTSIVYNSILPKNRLIQTCRKIGNSSAGNGNRNTARMSPGSIRTGCRIAIRR